ncbi:MAG: bifunctional phosphopantothenoylcysteine decarboxylase/phosphopantothenate--cysteine ligase CoaBC [Gammaproteobacteria bacterium]|nr:bifunctional phosphopantothenoylcysteine decarboxylase/phosphopantothenate--cysteine ligase CoaBC [Gammaproteobacteria bacterium]MDP2139557.1 bifunctional phosphopantothenoylcysteine decarboxylase/phosphopantothenate--cysteine ligase CoaBC [Gammaproteobacteria bacterium]MDP2346530.1 bifunctional phosphopantothenoylcysteine decarboxylase/phosphopantothenate--cysteine ligase CoaBC [Gammaproteobacteria bacterium]
MKSLSTRRVLLGITGGIAAYKSAELTRLLIKAGAEVRVVMTRAATEFITPLTMQALSGNRVHTELLDAEAEAGMGHIELARWPDLILIAPASADFIARLAVGHASDILSTLVLASKAPLAIAPAMNQAMWSNAATQENLNILRQRGAMVFGPGTGDQACGDNGPGRMTEPQELLELSAALFPTGLLAGLKVTITAGPTQEAIDPVRYISNRSSGKMGYALAAEAAAAGALVTLISGPVALATPDRVKRIDVVSAEEMLAASVEAVRDCDIFVGVAAVADYRLEQVATQKIKKSADSLVLNLVRNPDIISTIAALEKRPFTVGFAAETDNMEDFGVEKLQRKKLDLLFANDAGATLGSDSIAAIALWPTGRAELGPASKRAVAVQMLAIIKERLDAK